MTVKHLYSCLCVLVPALWLCILFFFLFIFKNYCMKIGAGIIFKCLLHPFFFSLSWFRDLFIRLFSPHPLLMARNHWGLTGVDRCLLKMFIWTDMSSLTRLALVIFILILFRHINESVASVCCCFFSLFYNNDFLANLTTETVVNLSYTNTETDFSSIFYRKQNDTRTLSPFTMFVFLFCFFLTLSH